MIGEKNKRNRKPTLLYVLNISQTDIRNETSSEKPITYYQ